MDTAAAVQPPTSGRHHDGSRCAVRQAQVDVKTLSSKPSNDDLLRLYSLFNQGTAGDAKGAKKPGWSELVAKANYEAWTKVAGTSADEAKTSFIAEVDRLIGH